MPELYVLKLLRLDGGCGMYFDSWGAGLTANLKSARRFNNGWQASDASDNWNEAHPDKGLFMCRESKAVTA